MAYSKVHDAAATQAICERMRQQGMRLVLARGVFDVMHYGHIKHLQEAATFGDALIVSVTADRYVNKGPGRPVFPQRERADVLAALACVAHVFCSESEYGLEDLGVVRPTFFIRGREYMDKADPRNLEMTETCARLGVTPVFSSGPVRSSSTVINRELATVPAAAQAFLEGFRKQYSFAQIEAYFTKAQAQRWLVAGEYIADEYVWVKALGKAGKEPCLAVEEQCREQHDGGSTAICHHLKDFTHSQQWAAGRSFKKTRFVEQYPIQKLFEVYKLLDEEGPAETAEPLGDFDGAMVADYGHGMMTPARIAQLQDAQFLAVNVQSNAGNHGFSTLSKYHLADYVAVSANELRLDFRDRTGDLAALMEAAAARLVLQAMTVTRGNEGVCCWTHGGVLAEVPAFTDHFADRVGAGDAVLAITALLAQQGAPAEVLGFVANCVGALAVQIIGNREPVTKAALLSYMKALLA